MKPDVTANQISAINRLHMVHFYHLTSEDDPVYGILAYYQDKAINLCNTEPHFTALFDRLAKVYADESGSGCIIADEETVKILGQANAHSESFYEKMLRGFMRIKTPMIVPKAFSHIYILPIVKYIINTLYDNELQFSPRDKQWFGNGILEASKGTQTLHFPCRLLPAHGVIEVITGNVVTAGNTLKISITTGRWGIAVSYHDTFHAYEGSLIYTAGVRKASLTRQLNRKEEILLNGEDEIAPVKGSPAGRIPDLTGIPAQDWNAYDTPWGGRFYTAVSGNLHFTVMTSSYDGMNVSHCTCFQYLSVKDDAPDFGQYSLCLYERDDITELHFLPQAPPGSGLYAARYADSYYTIQENR